MSAEIPAALDFLLTRRSYPARTLALPIPDRAQIGLILTAAARVPDHGKLEPWRFIVLHRPALQRLAGLVAERAIALNTDPEKRPKTVAQYAQSDLAIVVVSVPKSTVKVPLTEQFYSAGAVCFALLQAATALGYGANWLSGWPSYDRVFLTQGLGLAPDETMAGIIHIGTVTDTVPDRPRPDLSRLTTWADA
jgi:nitroreductase